MSNENRCYICGKSVTKEQRSEMYEGHLCHSECVDEEERYERENMEVA